MAAQAGSAVTVGGDASNGASASASAGASASGSASEQGGAAGSGGVTSGGTAPGGSGGASAGGGAGGKPAGCIGLFCEDFESGQLDPAVWTIKANQGQTMKVQGEQVAHGKYAAQFHGAPNVVSYNFIVASHAPAELRGHHYGRAYFHVTPKPPQKHTAFIFAGTAGFPKLKYLEVAESDLGWQLTYVKLTEPTGESYTPATGAVPLAKWACLEWEMNDMPDQIRLSVDGKAAASFDDISFMGKKSGLVGDFTDFGFGYYIWHPATYEFDVYYDDIVLDTKPIGCLP